MRIQVCVPTYSKTDKDIISLYHFLNLTTDALFSVQKSNENKVEHINVGGCKVTIVRTTDIGVSKNRNSLLDNATGDIIINIDDDCPLVDDYVSIVENTFLLHNSKILIIVKKIHILKKT